MKYIENKVVLKTVTKDLLKNVLKIYDTNEEYFKVSMNGKPSIESIIEDKNDIPPGSNLQNKNYKLISINGQDIGIIDYVMNYPDEDTVYIGLFIIHGDFHRQGYGSAFVEEFAINMRKRGYCRLRLGVLKENKNGFEFWTRMGFKVVKEIISTIHPERNWEIKVMEKII
ncbi:MAG: GNAT family N-acetyltransferase [Clostridiaceae bacterium]|nr:GNAT family N-acetyltransferase [Clostridiaceae bacterium]MBW4861081.1 GNAT family N-acetyltransferase [Clostridiaceae bacterium]MBW4867706.1 GNAT family N-acetyltransferase [Clostridiaceae bacterium]